MIDTKKTLYRLPRQGQLAGVCAGLAEYLDIDVTLMRVIWVVSIFITGGASILLYLILAVVVPSSNEKITLKTKAARAAETDETFGEKMHNMGKDIQTNAGTDRVRNIIGFCLLVLGVWLLLVQFFPQWMSFRWDFIWPVILIIAGVLIIIRRK